MPFTPLFIGFSESCLPDRTVSYPIVPDCALTNFHRRTFVLLAEWEARS